MANNRNGNIIWADTASKSFANDKRILGIIVHCTGAGAARVTLGNNNSATSYPTLVDFEVPAASDFAHLDFSTSPLFFPDGIRIKAVTNCTMSIIIDVNRSF